MAKIAMSRRKKRLTLALVTILMLTGAGVAFAFWTSTGSGDGSAVTGTSTVFTIEVDPATGPAILPGGAGQTVDFTVTNPGPGTQSLTLVTVKLADPTGVVWDPPAGCLLADYTATVTTPPAYGEMAAGADVTGTATVTLANTSANQDACKDAPVPLYFSAS